MTITVEQVKEARKLLGWSQFRLAVRSTVDVTRINHFERGKCALTLSQLDRIGLLWIIPASNLLPIMASARTFVIACSCWFCVA